MLIAVAPSRAPPLNPTIRPLAGNNLGNQPSAGAPSGPPEGEAQGIPKKLAAFSGAGGRQISRTNANALAAKGDAGVGWWRNQWGRAVIWVAVSKPWSSSGVGWGGGVPLGQRISRRWGGWGRAWPMRSAAAKRPEPPSSTTTRSLPGPDVVPGETSGTIQGQASQNPAAEDPSNRATNTWRRFWPSSTIGELASARFAPPPRNWPSAQG